MSKQCLLESPSAVRDDQSAQSPSEHDLVRQAQAGDRRAFATLVEQYWGKIYGWLYRLTRNRHVAEDVTQETFLKALRAIASFKAGTYFRAWLFRIAHNSWLSQRRRATAHQTAPEDVPARRFYPPPKKALNRSPKEPNSSKWGE